MEPRCFPALKRDPLGPVLCPCFLVIKTELAGPNGGAGVGVGVGGVSWGGGRDRVGAKHKHERLARGLGDLDVT